MKCIGKTYIRIVYLFLTLIYFSACSTSKQSTKIKYKEKRTENKKTAFIVDQVKQNEFYPNTISFKANTTVKSGSKSNSFRASFKIRKDSIIWISITKLGYEAARVYATPDTLMIINRIEKKYFAGNYKYLEEKYHINLNFSYLQSMLLGNSIGLEEPRKLKRTQNRDFYKLSSLSKRKLKRVTEKGRIPTRDLVFVHKIDPETFRVINLSILDLHLNQSAEVGYSDHLEIEGKSVPQKVNMQIRSNQIVEVEAEYSKIELNNKLSFPFKISKKYEPLQ